MFRKLNSINIRKSTVPDCGADAGASGGIVASCGGDTSGGDYGGVGGGGVGRGGGGDGSLNLNKYII